MDGHCVEQKWEDGVVLALMLGWCYSRAGHGHCFLIVKYLVVA